MFIPHFVQNEVGTGAANRLSAWNFCNPFDYILPFADSTVSALDRQHLWGLYSGIAAGPPDVPDVGRKRPPQRLGHYITAEKRARDRFLAIQQDDEEMLAIIAIYLRL